MDRIYNLVLKDHLKNHKQMFFIAGPRQVGKTTLAKSLADSYTNFYYFNWDNLENRKLILSGQKHVAESAGLNIARAAPTIIVFDEIHKYPKWKSFLKGFYDEFKDVSRIVVTGSSKLDVYRRGGDSMMGRYFLYHMYPLTIGELIERASFDSEIYNPCPISIKHLDSLWNNNGFPDPFLKDSNSFTNRWKRIRNRQLFKEDIRDLSNIHEIDTLEVMAQLITSQIGQLINRSELAQKIQTSVSTVSRWLKSLESFFFCFEVKPWFKNIRRSLVKEPKVYLYDWSMIDEVGARAENFVALHLQKFVYFNNDYGRGDYKLCYLRNKDKQEVDFVVIKNNKPWFLVEVKYSNNSSISKNLYYFQKETGAKHAFHVVIDMPYVDVDCFKYTTPTIVPASTLLSQFV